MMVSQNKLKQTKTRPDMNDTITRIENAARHLLEVADQLQTEMDKLPSGSLGDAAKCFFEAKEAHTMLENARKAVGKKIDFMNKVMIPEMLEAHGSDKVQIPEIGRSFYILTKTSCSMLDKEKGMKWLRDRGDGSLISETVSAGTLASYAKDLVVNEGVDMPDDIFKLSTYNITGVSKYTPK